MCETTAYVLSDGKEEMIMESMDRLLVEGDEIVVSNIFGEKRIVQGRIKEIDFNNNRLLIVA